MALRAAQVWIPSKDHAWVRASVLSFNAENDDVTVKNPEKTGEDGEETLVIPQSAVHLVDPSHLVLHDDLCSMNRLHDAPLLDILRRRYTEDRIYSTTSDMILVSVNPYKAIPDLYTNPLRFFDVPADGEAISKGAMPPHVFSVANGALYALINPRAGGDKSRKHNTNQSIVVSGESGAGKTEASKQVMNFLVAANTELVKRLKSGKTANMEKIASRIALEVVGSNLVFEAFGNAKTVRNDNSSRFGKYIKLQYSTENVLLSAYTDTFLLEKSRILSVNSGESNYHVFYYLVRGLEGVNATLAEELGLAGAGFDKFRILTDGQQQCYWDKSGDDENLEALMNALDHVNFSRQEQEEIFRLLAVVLHLGNVTLKLKDDDSNSVDLQCTTIAMETLASMLGLDPNTLRMKLTQRLVRIRGRSSVATKQLNEKEIRNNINAFIKMIYTGIFSFIVRKINFAHSHPDQKENDAIKFIGILDIFGFEIFQHNSFEQLCINFANERLQQHFNEHVFVSEQEEYAREGLDASFITYSDNQDVIDLVIKKPSGIFCVLDDFAKVNKTDDAQLLINYHQAHGGADGNSRFLKPRLNYQECFTIQHFAGSVTYTIGEGVDSFLFKNNDALEEGLAEGVLISSNEFFKNIGCFVIGNPQGSPGDLGYVPELASSRFGDEEVEESSVLADNKGHHPDNSSLPAPPPPSGHAMASSKTVSKRFISQVNRLMSTLQMTEPHYVKCMKPNTNKAAAVFEGPLMLEQLRYSGVLEVVRIRREGFPWKNSYLGFYKEFEMLTVHEQHIGEYPPVNKCSEARAREITQALCSQYLGAPSASGENVGKDLYACGATRMYMREEGFNQLSQHLNLHFERCAAFIQARIRRIQHVKFFQYSLQMIVKLQAWARMRAKVTWKALELARIAHEAAVEAARIAHEAAVEAARLQALEEERQLQQMEKAERERILAEKKAARVAAEEAEKERLRLIEEAEKERLRLIEVAIQADKKLLNDFTLATEGGDVAAMKALLADHPDLATRKSELPGALPHTPFQNACCGGAFSAIKFLNPAPHEVHSRDSAGFNSLALLLSTSDAHDGKDLLSICQYLSKAACENFPMEDAFDNMDYLCSRADKWAEADINTAAFNVGVEEEKVTGVVLKEGWLSKMHQSYLFTASWGKRWVRLTDSALYYFKQSNDNLPRDSVELTKGAVNGMTLDFFDGPGGPAVKISFNSLLKSDQKGRTTMSLMATNKTEMEQWARPLKAIMGMINNEAAVNEDLADNWQYVNPAAKKALIGSVTSRAKLTTLHVLANHDGKGRHAANAEAAKVAAWLVANGVAVDAKSGSTLSGEPTTGEGVTALQMACSNGNMDLALAVACHGATLEGKVLGNPTLRIALDGLGQDGMNTLATAAKRYGALPRLLPQPPQLPQYTYLSFFFMGNTYSKNIPDWDADPKAEPVLVVSVVSHANELIEKVQVASVPIMKINERELWWGKMWHLQTPLDNTPNDARVIIEARSSADPVEYACLGWSYFRLQHSSMATSSEATHLRMHQWTSGKSPSLAELCELSTAAPQTAGKEAVGEYNLEIEVICSRKA